MFSSGKLVFFLVILASVGSFACVGPKGISPGQCAPDFTVKDLKGNSIRLSELRGKVAFIHFWATWCKPCAEEIPSLEKLYSRLDSKKVAFVGISIDQEGKSALDRFFRNIFGDKWPTFPIVLDSSKKVAESYGTFKVPETFIVSPKGVVQNKLIGKRDWDDSVLESYLNLLYQSNL